MSLEIVRGCITNTIAIEQLISILKSTDTEGTFYAGYPIIASADSSHTIEALLVSSNYGLVVFNFPNRSLELSCINDLQDKLFFLLEGNLNKHEELRRGRHLAVTPNVISFFPTNDDVPVSNEHYKYCSNQNLIQILSIGMRIDDDYWRPLCAAIQRITTMKPHKKRENVKKEDSKGGVLKRIEKEIANLDKWQEKAAIEIADGPQRIRGLAGSGKTIVLALKASYLHSNNPNWNIVVTFQTRALSQQFHDLIERFSLQHSGDKPNWSKIRILNAWGSSFEPGVYSEIAYELGVVPDNFALAKSKFGSSGAFKGICDELLAISAHKKVDLFDAVLIDEAQDLPDSFFKLIYKVTKNPKRIIWAYDELQTLSNQSMPSVSDLFGKDENNQPLVSVINNENEPLRDIILPICYRNTPWSLTLAHALGFGIYRSEGLVQLFDELTLWKQIGYKVESGELNFDKQVTLSRKTSSYPSFFIDCIEADDAFITNTFNTSLDQYEWIAEQIRVNIEADEIDHDDILVIFPNAYTSKQEFQNFNKSLSRRGLMAHLAGVSTSRDTFKRQNSITAASIFRAKGNEAPMVYIVNSEWCTSGFEMIKLRNTLFTAITRSRAWVRLCGVGPKMKKLEEEIGRCVDNEYKLSFTIPTRDKLQEIRLINRDRTEEEINDLVAIKTKIDELKTMMKTGDKNPEIIEELKDLLELFKENDMND